MRRLATITASLTITVGLALTITFALPPAIAQAALPRTFTTGFADTIYYDSCPPADERSVNDEINRLRVQQE